MNSLFVIPGGIAKRRWFATLAALLTISCMGCLQAKHYLEPQLRDLTLQGVVPTDTPRLVKIDFEYDEFPLSYTFFDRRLRPEIVHILTSSTAFVEADSSNVAHADNLRVILRRRTTWNDIAVDWKIAASAWSLGLIGTDVTQGYDMTVVYTPQGGTPTTWEYDHIVHAALGLREVPDNAKVLTRPEVKNQMMEEMLLKFVGDFQAISNVSPAPVKMATHTAATSMAPDSGFRR